jgi:6-pyruvoyltetrahydropterin/6-carboxytetrahydropterin synthase
MFEISVEESFAAGHALREYHGKCERLHGHNYKVQVTLAGERLDSIGLLVDFVEVKRLLHAVADRMDHQFLNEIEPFDVQNPSAENMAKYFHDEISKGLTAVPLEVPVRVALVKVWETDTSVAIYRP